MKKIGWHFINGDKLRDGTTAPADGEWLEYKGELKMCASGLHFFPLVARNAFYDRCHVNSPVK